MSYKEIKFDSKVDREIFLGYFYTSKTYRVVNSRTLVVEKSIHVKFNHGLMIDRKLSNLEDDFIDIQIGSFVAPEEVVVKKSKEILPQIGESFDQKLYMKDWKFVDYHSQDQIIGD